MAILTGFPPANTISPCVRITEKDLSQPAIETWMDAVEWPARKKLEDHNFWLWRRRIRGTDKVRVTARVFKPVLKPDKSKQPRFMSVGA